MSASCKVDGRFLGGRRRETNSISVGFAKESGFGRLCDCTTEFVGYEEVRLGK